ncbi:MAG: hypothetical protein MASP_01223 [Candidatus Methanolliviera sp. GoM_asphalt]|nr:MAG: hypothetical protein MASP_01223 [Candidatus Methanolliviera sp. GoM_asphalt]
MFNSDKTYKSIEKGSRMRVPRVYANSPFKPLYEHAAKGIEAVQKLREVLDAFWRKILREQGKMPRK